MIFNETYRKYFDSYGLKNIFSPILDLADLRTEKWIAKSSDEIDRFANYIILIDKYEKIPVDNLTLRAIHESLIGCSVSIVFCIFNIFALKTSTEASFFDDHFKDYFKDKATLNTEELYLLSFNWHTSIQSINSLSYSDDEKLCIYNFDNKIGFKIIDRNSYFNTRKIDESDIINSKEFFTIHLLFILSTIDLLASLLSDKCQNLSFGEKLQSNSYLEIENINDFMIISEDILPSLE